MEKETLARILAEQPGWLLVQVDRNERSEVVSYGFLVSDGPARGTVQYFRSEADYLARLATWAH